MSQCGASGFRLGRHPIADSLVAHGVHFGMNRLGSSLRLRHGRNRPRNSDSQLFHVEHQPVSARCSFQNEQTRHRVAPTSWPKPPAQFWPVGQLAGVGRIGYAAGRLCGAEGGGGGGWGSISARVQYLGTPLTHSAYHQRTVSPITPTPHLTQAPLRVIFPTCHRLIPSHQPNRDAPV